MDGGPDEYIRVSKDIVYYILLLYSELLEHVQDNGSILMLLLKAMYGCIQASKLWYNLLTKILRSRGYVASENDPCVMRRVVNGMIFVILIYVDDLLVFANQEETDGLRALLTASFSAITMLTGHELSYLGMQMVWSDKGFEVSMEYYKNKCLKNGRVCCIEPGRGLKTLSRWIASQTCYRKRKGNCSIP